jgi:hypothetical protein
MISTPQRAAVRRVRRRVAGLLATGFALGACGGDSTSPSESAYGTYVLTSANGHSLPADVVNANTGLGTIVITWRSGSLQIRSDGTWQTLIDQTISLNGASTTAPDEREGTYTRSGNNFSFEQDGVPVITGMLSGDALSAQADLSSFGIPQVATAVFTKS